MKELIVEDLQKILKTNIQSKNAYRFLSLLKDKADGKTNLIQLPVSVLEGYLPSAKYKQTYIEPLMAAGYIEVDDRYFKSTGRDRKGQCKAYRITNDYLPIEKQTKHLITDMNKIFTNTTIDEDTFFSMEDGPEGYVKVFGEEDLQDEEYYSVGDGPDIVVNTKKTFKYNYKGIETIDLVITKQDLDTFKDYVNLLKLEGVPISETTLSMFSGNMDKYKLDFLYNKWKCKNS